MCKNPDLGISITYTANLDRLGPDTLTNHIHHQLDLVGLPRHTFTDDAVALILRASKGNLRDVNNPCLGSLIEAVNDRTKTVGARGSDKPSECVPYPKVA